MYVTKGLYFILDAQALVLSLRRPPPHMRKPVSEEPSAAARAPLDRCTLQPAAQLPLCPVWFLFDWYLKAEPNHFYGMWRMQGIYNYYKRLMFLLLFFQNTYCWSPPSSFYFLNHFRSCSQICVPMKQRCATVSFVVFCYVFGFFLFFGFFLPQIMLLLSCLSFDH